MPKKLSREVLDEIQRLYDSGMRYAEISRELNISDTTVADHVENKRPITAARSIPDSEIEEIKRLRVLGFSIKQIAGKVGRSRITVASYLRHRKRKTTLTGAIVKEANRLHHSEGLSISAIAKKLNATPTLISEAIENMMTQAERLEKFPPKPKNIKGVELDKYMEEVAPEAHKPHMIQALVKRMRWSYTEAETYYEAWRKDYMKRRAL